MIDLYDYTDEKKVLIGSFNNWSEAQKVLSHVQKENPRKPVFISGYVNGKFQVEGCPVNILDL